VNVGLHEHCPEVLLYLSAIDKRNRVPSIGPGSDSTGSAVPVAGDNPDWHGRLLEQSLWVSSFDR